MGGKRLMTDDFTRWWCLTISRNGCKEKIYAQSTIPLFQIIYYYYRDDQENIKFKLETVKTKLTH